MAESDLKGETTKVKGFQATLVFSVVASLFIFMIWRLFVRLLPALYESKKGNIYVGEQGLFRSKRAKRQSSSPNDTSRTCPTFHSLYTHFKLQFSMNSKRASEVVVNTIESEQKGVALVEAGGMSQRSREDEVALISFCRILAFLFLGLTLIVSSTLIPFNMSGQGQATGLDQYTILNRYNDSAKVDMSDLVQNSEPFWLHVIMSYIVVGSVSFAILLIHSTVARLRHQYLTRNALNQYSLCGKLLILRDIPKGTSSHSLYEQFDRLFPGKVAEVTIDKDEADEFYVIEKLRKHRNQLEKALTLYLKKLTLYQRRNKVPFLDQGWDLPPGFSRFLRPENEGMSLKQFLPTFDRPIKTDEQKANNDDSLPRCDSSSFSQRSAPFGIDIVQESGIPEKIVRSCRPRIRSSHLSLTYTDAIDHHLSKIHELELELAFIKEKGKTKECPKWAMVVFTDFAAAQLAYNGVHILSNPLKACRMVGDIDPSKDLLWGNMSQIISSRMSKNALSTFFMIVVTLFWVPLNALLTSPLSLDKLEKTGFYKQLGRIFPKDNAPAIGIVFGLIPSTAVVLLFALLPPTIKKSVKMIGHISKSQVDSQVYKRLFIFLLIVLFFVVVVLNSLSEMILNPLEFFQNWTEKWTERLVESGTAFPKFAPAFINYIILWALVETALHLLQPEKILLVQTLITLFARTPRDLYNVTRVTKFEPGIHLAKHTFVAIIGITYSTAAPLTLVFVALYFCIRWLAYSHLFRHMYIFAHPNGGLIFSSAASNLFAGLYMHGIFMLIFYASKCAVLPFIFMILLLILTSMLHHMSGRYQNMAQQLPLQSISSSIPQGKTQLAIRKYQEETLTDRSSCAESVTSQLSITLQKQLTPRSLNYKEVWVPLDRYGIVQSILTPLLSSHDFAVRTDHAYMDEYGRVTIKL